MFKMVKELSKRRKKHLTDTDNSKVITRRKGVWGGEVEECTGRINHGGRRLDFGW